MQRIMVFTFIIVLTSCSFLPSQRNISQLDWYTMKYAPLTRKYENDLDIPQKDIFELGNIQRKLVVNLLLNKKIFMELTAEQAKLLVGKDYHLEVGKKIILIRTIQLEYGKYSLFSNGTDLYIINGKMGSSIGNFHKSALIVHVDFLPKNLYIGVDVVQ